MEEVQIDVLFSGQSHTFTMTGGGTTVLEAAIAAGVEVPHLCMAGSCSTCRAKLVSGSATMLNNIILDDAEIAAGFILACQAVPRSEHLVLDFDAV